MYQKMKIGDRYFFSSNVAPPADDLLPDDLADLSISHILMAQNQFFTPFNDTINSATDDQIDRARLQFSHSIEAAQDKLHNFANNQEFDQIRGNKDWQTILTYFTKHIQSDVISLQKKCKSSPNSVKVAQTLTSALENYCEAVVILQNVVLHSSYENDIWQKEVEEIFTNFNNIHTTQDALVALAPHYPNIQNNVKSFSDIIDNTIERLNEQLEHKYVINFKDLERVAITCGQKDQLWHIVQDAQYRQEQIDKGYYHPLDNEDCTYIRKNITNLYSSLDCANKTGIVNLLQSISIVCDHEAYKRLTKSEIDPYEAYEQHVQSMHTFNERMKYKLDTGIRDKDEFITIAKEDQIFNNQYSLRLTRLGDSLREGLLEVSQILKLSNDFTNAPVLENTLTFTKQDDLFLGKFNNDDSKMVVVYPMTGDNEGFLSAKLLPKELTKNSIPSLDDVHALEDVSEDAYSQLSLSCFYSFAGMMGDFQDESVQKHMLGNTYKIIDNTEINLDTIVGYKYKK